MIGTGLTVHEVDAACVANRLGVVVPCVLKADGSISGYRYGFTASASS